MSYQKRAVVEISYAGLAKALKLPPDVQIMEVFQDQQAFRRMSIVVRLSGNGLPDNIRVAEGDPLPLLELWYEHGGDVAKFQP